MRRPGSLTPLLATTVLLAVAGFGPVAAQQAQEGAPAAATVEVTGRQLGEVPDLALSGFNYGNSMLVVGNRPEFARLHIGSLRFPPGNQADEIELGRHDLAALLQNLELLGRPPVLMVANLFSGSPEQAAGLARLALEMGVPILGWEIGNEPDLYGENRSDPSWTPERYCRGFREYREALLEVDPGFTFAGPAVSGARPSAEEYLREVLRLCGDVIDLLTWHVYPTDGTWSDGEALATADTFGEELRRYREWAADPGANPLGHEREIGLGVTEFGLSWRSPSFRHLEDMTAAIWLGDVLGQMVQERLDLSHYFALQAMGGHGLIDRGGWVRPTYHVYRMLADFSGSTLEVQTDGPLRGYAVRSERGLRLLLINMNEHPVEARLVLPDSVAGRGLEVELLSGPAFDEHGAPILTHQESNQPLLLPPLSVAVASAATPAGTGE